LDRCFGWNGSNGSFFGAKIYIAAQVNPFDPFHPKHLYNPPFLMPDNPSFLMPAGDALIPNYFTYQ